MYHGDNDEQFTQDPYMDRSDDRMHTTQPVNNNMYYYDDDEYDNPILHEEPYNHRQTFIEVDTTAHEANLDITPQMMDRAIRESSHPHSQPMPIQRDLSGPIPSSNFEPIPVRPNYMNHDLSVMRDHEGYADHSSHQVNLVRNDSIPRTNQLPLSSNNVSVPPVHQSYVGDEEDYILEQDRSLGRERTRETRKDHTREKEKDRDRDRDNRKKTRKMDQDRNKTTKSKSKAHSHVEKDRVRNNEIRSKKERKKTQRHGHVKEAGVEESPRVKHNVKNKDVRNKRNRNVDNNYENNSYKDSGARKSNKRKMPMLKKIVIASSILLLLLVVTFSVLIFSRQRGNNNAPSSTNANTGLRPGGTTLTSSKPTPYPTMSPTLYPLTPRPTPTSNVESGNINCPTIQELSGLCGRDDDDDYYLDNAPSPYQNTGQGGLSSPTLPTEDCPMYMYVLGSCGTRVPTPHPATRQPVAVVSADAVCTPEKFQVRYLQPTMLLLDICLFQCGACDLN